MKYKINYIPEGFKDTFAKRDVFIDFKSLSNYKNWMIENKDYKNPRTNESMRNNTWHGSSGYDSFIDLLDNGDEKVMSNIRTETKKSIKEFSKKYEEKLINYKFDVIGECFDIGLVMTGVPETWLEPEFQEEEKVQIEILIDGTFPDGTDLDLIIKNAGKVLGMVKILEDHGVEVKIRQVLAITNHNTEKPSEKLLMMVDVKDYDEPLNYKKCSALMSPTFLRRGGFKVLEVVTNNLKYNYGHVLNTPNTIKLLRDKDIKNLERRLFK